MTSWKGINKSPKRESRSARMSRASSCTETSSILIAFDNFPVIRWQTFGTSDEEFCGNSEMTVFNPMLEISRNCSLLLTMFVHRVSTIVSTWGSFTLFTRGPRLK